MESNMISFLAFNISFCLLFVFPCLLLLVLAFLRFTFSSCYFFVLSPLHFSFFQFCIFLLYCLICLLPLFGFIHIWLFFGFCVVDFSFLAFLFDFCLFPLFCCSLPLLHFLLFVILFRFFFLYIFLGDVFQETVSMGAHDRPSEGMSVPVSPDFALPFNPSCH